MPLDIGIGFLGAILQALLGYEDLTVRLLVLGAVFALLPDVDFLVSALRKGSVHKVDHTHRDLLHHPVPYLAVGGLVVWLLVPQYTLLFMAMSLAHFIHDSIGVGWGIPWLSPLSRRYAKFFTDAATNETTLAHPVIVWTTEERDALIAKLHDPDWMQHEYAHLTKTAVVEYAAFAVALAGAIILTFVL